jgi:hypothetical protein
MHQCASSSVWNRYETHTSRASLITAKGPLLSVNVALMILAPAELPLVYFNSLVRIAVLLTVPHAMDQHVLSAELTPVSDSRGAVLVFLLEKCGLLRVARCYM